MVNGEILNVKEIKRQMKGTTYQVKRDNLVM